MAKKRLVTLLLAGVMILSLATGCSKDYGDEFDPTNNTSTAETSGIQKAPPSELDGKHQEDQPVAYLPDSVPDADWLASVAPFDGSVAWAEVNGNMPFFTEYDITTEPFETYADLDSLGRCGVAFANICEELMPTEERVEIGSVKPTGWYSVKYDNVDGKYLYNRCHLIGFQLAGENANEKNLITGTRYLNIEGMLPFENMVADYVHETDNHVLYRVTPIYTGDNLVADGVLMEGLSVEDEGADICFCVFAYNAQPGIAIDYATGESWAENASVPKPTNTNTETDIPANPTSTTEASNSQAETGTAYVLNTNSKKFHYSYCESATNTSEQNKEIFTGPRDEIIADGYEPCGVCHP